MNYYFFYYIAAGMVSTEDEDDMPYDMYTDNVEDRQTHDKKGESEEKHDSRDREEEHEQEEVLDKMQENIITDLVRAFL